MCYKRKEISAQRNCTVEKFSVKENAFAILTVKLQRYLIMLNVTLH